MKKNIVMLGVMLIATLLTACSTQTYVVRGQYDIANSVTTTTPYDQVWNNIIDFFAENSIPIGTLSKDSGLITSTNISFGENIVSYENENGVIADKNAWFVVPYCSVPKVVGARATCSFNVRVRQEEGQVKIQVNLSNMIGYYNWEMRDPMTLRKEIVKNVYPRECQSTGKFEEALLSLFQK